VKIIAYLGGSRGYAVLSSLILNKLKPEFIFIKSTSKSSSIKKLCKLNSIYVEEVDGKFSDSHVNFISREGPDIFVVSGFNSILPGDLLNFAKYGGINCHAGRLPEYRGAAVIPWQIINGETEGEAYILEMKAGIDDGDILAKETYSIEMSETSKHIINKVNIIFSNLVPKVIKGYLLSGKNVPKLSQDDSGVCTWTQRFPQDGVIEWDKLTAIEVVNLVRALDDPYPGAFTFYNNKKMFIWSSKQSSVISNKPPGTIIATSTQGILVSTGDGTLILTCIQFEDEEEIQGNQLEIGNVFKLGERFQNNTDLIE